MAVIDALNRRRGISRVSSYLMILGFYFFIGTNIAVICLYPFRNLIFHGTNISGGESVCWEAAYDPR